MDTAVLEEHATSIVRTETWWFRSKLSYLASYKEGEKEGTMKEIQFKAMGRNEQKMSLTRSTPIYHHRWETGREDLSRDPPLFSGGKSNCDKNRCSSPLQSPSGWEVWKQLYFLPSRAWVEKCFRMRCLVCPWRGTTFPSEGE